MIVNLNNHQILDISYVFQQHNAEPKWSEHSGSNTSSLGIFTLRCSMVHLHKYTVSIGRTFSVSSSAQAPRGETNCCVRPCLLSCVLGLLNIGVTMGVPQAPVDPALTNPTPQSHWNTASISALTLALVSSTIYGGLTFYTFRKVHLIRTNHKNRNSDSETMRLIPEDEQQRQQLLRLLLAKENERTSTSQQTYWIDLPEGVKNARESIRPGAYSNVQNVQMPYPAASNNYESQRRRSDSNPANERLAFLRADSQRPPEPPLKSPNLQKLEKARERAQQDVVRSRESSTGPAIPTIINSRSSVSDVYNKPLTERHPLERQELIQGAAIAIHPKDLKSYPANESGYSQISPASYTQTSSMTHSEPSMPAHGEFSRPEEENYSYQGSEEGRRIEMEMENRARLHQQASFESQHSQGLVGISKGLSGGRGSFGRGARRAAGGSGGGSAGNKAQVQEQVSEESEQEQEQEQNYGSEQLQQYEIARGRRRRDTAVKGLPSSLEADTAPRIAKVRTSDAERWAEKEW